MSDFGISVSTNGNDARIATGKQLVLTSKFPLAKIDRTNSNGLQNVRIQFNTNPPLGPVLVYKYKHGYIYTPSTWTLAQCVGVTAPYDLNPYIMESGSILHNSATSYCDFYAEVDSTYVYYYVNRYYNNLLVTPFSAVTIAGISLRIRTYVFVEDVMI